MLDNRGIGRSSKPLGHKFYTTSIMANDIIAVAGHIGWTTFHVVGFSMGGMISTRLASLYPERILSLSLLGVTGGRWQILPRSWRSLKYFIRSCFVRTPEDKAKMDMKFHFSKAALKEKVGLQKQFRRDLLLEEYLETHLEGQAPSHGIQGQLWACWKHRLKEKDINTIRGGGFPVQVIHGRHDVVAHKKYGRRIAKKLGAQMVEVDGGHLITRECVYEVNKLLEMTILSPFTHKDRSWHFDRSLRSKSARMSAAIIQRSDSN